MANNNTYLHSISVDLSSPTSNDPPSTALSSLKLETTDFSKYLRRIAGIDVSYIPCTVITIGFDIIFTLITLVMGSSNISSCQVDSRIPVYLVVVATVNIVIITLTVFGCFLHIKKSDENLLNFFLITICAIIIIILQIFCFIWLICGTVWTFRVIDRVQYTPANSPNYCPASVYRYTQISIILQYIIPFVLCCCRNATFCRGKLIR